MGSSAFTVLLEQCSNNFGTAPRRFGIWSYSMYLKTPRPLWLKRSDGLTRFMEGQRELLSNGTVVWGHIIQANSRLFKKMSGNSPASILYATDHKAEVTPHMLMPVAQEIYSLKGVKSEEAERQFLGDCIADEMRRDFALSVPRTLCPEFASAITTVLINRAHLPDNRLAESYFPMVLSQKNPGIAMPLPSRYWPESLVRAWRL